MGKNIMAVCSEIHTKHNYNNWAECRKSFNVKPCVQNVTNGRQIFNVMCGSSSCRLNFSEHCQPIKIK